MTCKELVLLKHYYEWIVKSKKKFFLTPALPVKAASNSFIIK